ncbi:MAG: FG-GAP-like repeat-containing protein [Chloroflexi bacterium]|nr:FG-GAP-like repeat-containing protein [Chloroflexota bacterium]MCL5275878.1 FG-GAP-like repeat-containing protein [Chloroflexota bacterium]
MSRHIVRPVILLAVMVFLLLANTIPAKADWGNWPTPQVNFPKDLSAGRPYSYLPQQITVANVDTTHNTKEIVLATQTRTGNTLTCGGRVYVYNADGSVRWEAALPMPPGMGPSVADLNGDGVNDVVVGYGELFTGCPTGGGVMAFNGVNGNMLWNFATKPQAGLGGVYSTPAIADIDGSGWPEVVFGSWDQCIYVLDHNGLPIWNIYNNANYCNNQGYANFDTVFSTASLADLDGDGKLEIIIGSDISNPDGSPLGGYLNILRYDGTLLARHFFDEVIYSSPAVADLNGDGVLDIVVGTGDYIDNKGRYITSWHYDPTQSSVDMRLVLNWQKSSDGYLMSSPAIGDLNSDGQLDVVILGPNGNRNTTNGSYVYAWRGNDGTPLFKTLLCNPFNYLSPARTSPVIADVVGDGKAEVVLTQNYETTILYSDGTYYTDGPQTGSLCSGHPNVSTPTYWAYSQLDIAPAIADIDNTGKNAIIVAGAINDTTSSNYGRLYAWGGHNKGYAPWPQFHQNAAHTGLLDNVLPNNPSGFSVSPVTGTLQPAQTIRINWATGGKDIGSGLQGYSVVWDQNPDTIPDTSVNVAATATGISSMPGNGSWYAHLRAIDKAGNASSTTIHLGPFQLSSALLTHFAFVPVVIQR